jgi:type II secretory pathway component PulF
VLNFSYHAVDATDQRQSGTLQAEHTQAAMDTLTAQGLRVYELQLAGSAQAAMAAGSAGVMTAASGAKVTAQQRVWLLDELATLLEAGVPLADAIDSLQQGHALSALGAALGRANSTLRSGLAFSVALADAGLGLPRYVTELIRAGESTGRLAGAARAAAQQLLADDKFAREVRSALLYPAVLMSSGALAMLVVFVFVVPKFAAILANPKADLPLISLWVLHAGLWLGAHAMTVAAVLMALVVLAVGAARQAQVRQRAWEALGRMPVLGQWVRDAELYRWSAMLAVLTQHRVGLLEALAQANSTLRARLLAAQGQRVADAVRQGKSLVAALAEQQLLDAPALALVRVGERSGALDKTLQTLAARYQSASQQRIQRFLVLLEPITILLISVVLGGVMISVILAVTSLTNVI